MNKKDFEVISLSKKGWLIAFCPINQCYTVWGHVQNTMAVGMVTIPLNPKQCDLIALYDLVISSKYGIKWFLTARNKFCLCNFKGDRHIFKPN